MFPGARNGLLLDPYNGFLDIPFFMFYFFFLLIFSVTVSHSFNKRASQKQSLRNSRLAQGTGVKQKKKKKGKVCSAAVMPNKAAKAAQTHRLSDAPSASMMHAVEMNPCMEVSLKRSLSLAAHPSPVQHQPGCSVPQRSWGRPTFHGEAPWLGSPSLLLMPEILTEEQSPRCQKRRL